MSNNNKYINTLIEIATTRFPNTGCNLYSAMKPHYIMTINPCDEIGIECKEYIFNMAIYTSDSKSDVIKILSDLS